LKVWNDISKFNVKNPVITIGSFDGVHLGHKFVLNQLNNIAAEINGESVVFTFHPHPVRVLHPEKEFVLLTTIEEKAELFEKAGVTHLIIFPFTTEFSQLSYNKFIKNILVDKLHINTILAGYDNAVGKNKEGNYEQLAKLSIKYNFNIIRHNELKLSDEKISSTNIRNLLTQGKLFEASKILGYPYILSGKVVHGQRLGNKLGFPTANIMPPENKFIPGNGVYAITVDFKGLNYKGMMNIGVRPTIEPNTQKPVIEAHLFDFKKNIYGEFIKINIIRKLRNESLFESVEALRIQLKKDKQFALETLANIL
jgi:riboflavin kinase/FMN adenylyltransferase